jgi:5'-deoxynucleotidase YfbR-like HD superfamily hydrolase
MWAEFIETTRECQRLDYVWRYSTIPISVPENVTSHSYWVTIYAAMIHQALDPQDTDTLAACLACALVHDIPEMKAGDFVRTFKYRSKALKQAIDKAEREILTEFGPSMRAVVAAADSLVGAAKNPSYVRAVVKAADFMSLHNFMVREVSRGNTEIHPFFERMVADLRAMASENENVIFATGGKSFELGQYYSQLAQNAAAICAMFLRGKVI